MKRNPSIHITKEKFEEILGILDVPYFPVEAFFTLARRDSVNSRAILVKDKKTNKKATNITLASKGDASLVADIIYATRIKLHHQGVRKIIEGSADWAGCKKLAEICNEFTEGFEFESERAGFIKYIEIGIRRCNGNNRNLINRLISMSENIFTEYGNTKYMEVYLSDRIHKQDVKLIHDYYIQYIASNTGIYENLEDPDKYIHFCHVHELLSEHDWDYKEYIDAQFDALSFCNGIPAIDQLYGSKAIERYNKYLYKQNHIDKPIDFTKQVDGSLWNKIK
jgi:hypothetical protein